MRAVIEGLQALRGSRKYRRVTIVAELEKFTLAGLGTDGSTAASYL